MKVYDHYEITPYKRYEEPDKPGQFRFDVCATGEAEAWTLYGHIEGEGVEEIGDFSTREYAEEAYSKITGLPFLDSYRPDPRLRLMHAAPKLLGALQELLEQLEGVGIPDWRGAEGLCLKQARAVIAEATGNVPSESRKLIVIEVHGGVVQNVLNLPPSYQYEIRDYDNLEADEKAAGRQQSLLDKWLEKWDMPQESEPTNRDRARWAGDALAVFTDETFCGDHPDTMHRDDLECAIGDLIADLLHLAHQKGFDPQAILEHGNAHFKTELLLDE